MHSSDPNRTDTVLGWYPAATVFLEPRVVRLVRDASGDRWLVFPLGHRAAVRDDGQLPLATRCDTEAEANAEARRLLASNEISMWVA